MKIIEQNEQLIIVKSAIGRINLFIGILLMLLGIFMIVGSSVANGTAQFRVIGGVSILVGIIFALWNQSQKLIVDVSRSEISLKKRKTFGIQPRTEQFPIPQIDHLEYDFEASSRNPWAALTFVDLQGSRIEFKDAAHFKGIKGFLDVRSQWHNTHEFDISQQISKLISKPLQTFFMGRPTQTTDL